MKHAGLGTSLQTSRWKIKKFKYVYNTVQSLRGIDL